MPRNGSGGYSPPAGQPVVSGTAISSTVFNALVADLGNELTKSICTDGQTPMTANLPMGANRITNLAAAVAPTDALRADGIPTALGYTPYNATNPANYTTLAAVGGSYVAKSGSLLTGPLTWANNIGAVNFTDSTSATRGCLYMDSSDYVYMAVSGGKTIRWTNQVGNTVIAELGNTGAFSAVTLTQTSDERKKCNWAPLTDAQLDAFANMQKSGSFDWLDGSGRSVGGSAQEIQAIAPWAVHSDDEGNLSVNYGGLNFAIVQATLRRLWGQK